MKFKKWRKKLAIASTFVLLGISPFLMSATSSRILEVEVKVDDELKDILVIDADKFYQAALNDNEGISSFLDSLKTKALIALYRKEFKSDYDKLVANARTDLESQKKGYIDLADSEKEGLERFEEQLEASGFDTEEESIVSTIRTNITNVAFTELYKKATSKEVDDKGTPDDTSDDEEIEFDVLNANQLYWFDDWFNENRPLHVSQITFNLKADEDGDFTNVTMEDDDKEDLDDFFTEIRTIQASTEENVNFSGLASAYSSTNAGTGGHVGLVTYNGSELGDTGAKYNAYAFINDVNNSSLRADSLITIDANTTSDTFLTNFTTGERNYFYMTLKDEKFMVTRTAANKITFVKFFGMKDYIDPASRTATKVYKEYFKSGPRRYKTFSSKPFDIISIMNSYVTSRPYNEYLLAIEKDVIAFNDSYLIDDGTQIKKRINDYIKLKYDGSVLNRRLGFSNAIKDQNEKWEESDYKNQIVTTSLVDETKWGFWI